MKRQIRRSCFETNSSSTHAICITKEDYTKSNYIEFEIGEFGWEFDIYSDVHSRASYLITAIFNSGKDYADEKLQQLKDILDDNGIEYVIPTPKVDSWTYDGKTRYYYDINGYIDHVGETREFVEAVLSDSDKLFRYLFGDSMVITGNDNSNTFSDYMYNDLGNWHYELKDQFKEYEIYKKGN